MERRETLLCVDGPTLKSWCCSRLICTFSTTRCIVVPKGFKTLQGLTWETLGGSWWINSKQYHEAWIFVLLWDSWVARSTPNTKENNRITHMEKHAHLAMKQGNLFCFVCHTEILQTMVLHGVLLVSLESSWWVRVHWLRLRLFGATVWKLLIREPFSQWKLNKIKTENDIGIWGCSRYC
jgi:hypothetical protein